MTLSSGDSQKIARVAAQSAVDPRDSRHADHISGAQALKLAVPGVRLAIGSGIRDVQRTFAPVFGLENRMAIDGSQFDRLLSDDETMDVGPLRIKTIFNPGHTPACCSYLINDEALFTGDALFMPDSGTGRCDFPGGRAETLYESIHERIYGLPDAVRVYTGHDYQPGGRPLQFQSTVGEQKKKNIHLKGGNDQKLSLFSFAPSATKRSRHQSFFFPAFKSTSLEGACRAR